MVSLKNSKQKIQVSLLLKEPCSRLAVIQTKAQFFGEDKGMIETVVNMNSLERDREWLLKVGRYSNVDVEEFSDWVTRMMSDGMEEEEARIFVINNYGEI